jgi:hypothetical protein
MNKTIHTMNKFDFAMEDYRHYIDLLQQNINRMASNSASCKTWVVGMISALFAIQAIKEMTCLFLITIFPIVLFYFLDSYYLGLEKRFIKLETDLVNHIKMNKDEDYKDMYNLNPQTIGNDFRYTWKGMRSYSTWPFYGILILFVVVIFWFIK